MKNKKDQIVVDRGLPSVNENAKKRNYGKLIVVLLVISLIGIGVSYFIYAKLDSFKQSLHREPKRVEEKSAVKPRSFGAVESDNPIEAADPKADPNNQNKPEVPPVLGGTKPGIPTNTPFSAGQSGIAPVAPNEVIVPPIKPISEPDKPNSLDRRLSPKTIGGVLDKTDQGERNIFDTPFVINDGIQPGGKAGSISASSLNDTVRRGNEALAAAQNTNAGIGGGGGSVSRGDTGKGALTGLLTPTSTPGVHAGNLGDQNLTVRKGTPIECVLNTRIVAMLPGLIRCTLTSPLYSANGKVILADRGSEVVGEQSGALRQGQTRLYVLWSEINTPEGVTISIDSPGADALGSAGVDGDVDNHWGQRIGASLLLSLVEDAFAYEIAKTGNSSAGGSATSGVVFQGTQQQGQRIAEKVLDSTINIPPTLYKKQGDKISIIVSRHLDFSDVYKVVAK